MVKALWPSELDSLGVLLLLPYSQAGEPDLRLRPFMSVGELLWYNFSLNLLVVHLAVKGFDFITIAFLLPSCDFFVFRCRISFWEVPVFVCFCLFL